MLAFKCALHEGTLRLLVSMTKTFFKVGLLLIAALLGHLLLASAGGPTAVPVASATGNSAQKSKGTMTAATGTIAYIRDGKEVRLIEPNGQNDRRIWTSPIPNDTGVTEVAWNPAGTELALVSDHEGVVSFYERDVYAIRPDGSGLRKLTNAPLHDELAALPQGTVTVDVQVLAGGGPFFVYVSGAALPQSVIGGSTGIQRLTFTNVADFGDTLQPVVAIDGEYRWFNAGTQADVKPGQTVHAGMLSISGQGEWHFGVYPDLLTWRADGSYVGFLFGPGCLTGKAAVSPPLGVADEPLLQHNLAGWTCALDWAPLTSMANQVIVTESNPFTNKGHIYRMTEGNPNPGQPLISYDLPNSVLYLEWLPDGSGFLLSFANGGLTESNIYAYDFAAKEINQLTHFSGELAGQLSVSPDGQQVVFERSPTASGLTDLWIMNIDGSDLRLLVEDGVRPSWGVPGTQPPPPPPEDQEFAYIPVSLR